MSKETKVGQLVLHVNGKTWEYGVVNIIYDGKYEILLQRSGLLMFLTEEISEDFKVKHIKENQDTEFLFKNGEPVMAKKKLFGGYKFEAKKM